MAKQTTKISIEDAQLLYSAYLDIIPRNPEAACKACGIETSSKQSAQAKIDKARKMVVGNIDILEHAVCVLYDNMNAVKTIQVYNTSDKKKVPIVEPDYIARNAAAREIARVEAIIKKIKADEEARSDPFLDQIPKNMDEARVTLINDTIRQIKGCDWDIRDFIIELKGKYYDNAD